MRVHIAETPLRQNGVSIYISNGFKKDPLRRIH